MFLSVFPEVVGSPDDPLVTSARSGDAGAWAELTRHHRPPLLRFLAAQTGDPEAAADLVQQTFLDAWRRRGRLAPGRPFAPWLYRIARYNLLSWRRRRALLRFVSLHAVADRPGLTHPALRRPDGLGAVEEGELVRRALAGLSPPLREVLLLRELAGLTTREIGEAVGISRAAAERRFGRAAAAFRRRYAEIAGDP